ncbi:MAG: hypothetical protein MUP85_04595 [Candidatus Lokiarchaeota archaeon]|nr:hypothetical protein [Candidatus Lokiarchaeota archaeon]
MPENKVKKYFSLIEAWAWCDICDDMVALKLNKKEIIDGLKMGMYTKEYKHVNKYPDHEDSEDLSGQEHAIYIYINDNYDITGVKSFFGDSPSMADIGAAAGQTGEEVRIPIVVKDVPEMSVHLGMLTMEEYKLLKVCDGMCVVEEVASIVEKSIPEVEKMLDRMRKKGLVKVIRRSNA